MKKTSETPPRHPKSVQYIHWRTIVRGERGLSPKKIHDFAEEVGVSPGTILSTLYPLSPENGAKIEALFKKSIER